MIYPSGDLNEDKMVFWKWYNSPNGPVLRFPVPIFKHLRAAKDRSIIQVGEKRDKQQQN